MIPSDLVSFVSTVGIMIPWVLVIACFLADDTPTGMWWIAFAIFLSYPADIVQSHLASEGIQNHWVPAILTPIQLGIMLWVLAVPRSGTMIIGMGSILGFGASVLLGAPAILPAVAGGLAVSWAARPYKSRRAIWLYCLGVLPGSIFLEVVAPHDPRWLWVWAATQGVRWAAIGWLAWEVSRGSRYRQTFAPVPRGGRPYGALRPLDLPAAALKATTRHG